eukprot:1503431-Pleurochrysis_carterae.AAC.5
MGGREKEMTMREKLGREQGRTSEVTKADFSRNSEATEDGSQTSEGLKVRDGKVEKCTGKSERAK